MQVTLRPVRPEDEMFLLQVYASTRTEELALVNWTAPQKDAFLQMQFNAQRQSYRTQFPEAVYQIIQRDDVAIGRLIIDRSGDELLLIDIALLPACRNAGIGTGLIRDLMAEAGRTGKALRLHVEFFNPAQRLYERLGFIKIGASGIYYEMEWRAAMPIGLKEHHYHTQ